MTKAPKKYKFVRRHDGHCLTYYRDENRNLYCLMETGSRQRSQVGFYTATKSIGEPDCPYPMPEPDQFDRIEMPSNPWNITPELMPAGSKPSY